MTKSYRVIIVDDEMLARRILNTNMQRHSDIKVVAECENGFEGVKAVQKHQPDILFLDIQMPQINGFEMLELLENPPVIVFSTAYDQYAMKAFQVSAADYLLKPYTPERFDEALHRAKLLAEDRSSNRRQLELLERHQESEPSILDRIVVKKGSKIVVLPIEEVIRIEAQDDYVMLYTQRGNFLKQKTMTFFENKLATGEFLRIHRSHIIKLSTIRSIEKATRDSYQAVLQDGMTLPISRSGYQKLKKILQ
ncbi:MAG: LytR/AlgR family response regulator transcription factor [Calditrichia bacterium]